MKYYWLSWLQPMQEDRGYLPIEEPPKEIFLGYWCTGWVDSFLHPKKEEYCAVVVAWVKIKETQDLEELVRQYWPEFNLDWRFCDEKSNRWKPSKRFLK